MTEYESLSLWDDPAEQVTAQRTASMKRLAEAAVEPLWPYLSAASTRAEFEHRMGMVEGGIRDRVLAATGSNSAEQEARRHLLARWDAVVADRTANVLRTAGLGFMLAGDGMTAEVMAYPQCQICQKADAHWDGKTVYGPWAYMCDSCHDSVGLGQGMGVGQKLVLSPSSKEGAKTAANFWSSPDGHVVYADGQMMCPSSDKQYMVKPSSDGPKCPNCGKSVTLPKRATKTAMPLPGDTRLACPNCNGTMKGNDDLVTCESCGRGAIPAALARDEGVNYFIDGNGVARRQGGSAESKSAAVTAAMDAQGNHIEAGQMLWLYGREEVQVDEVLDNGKVVVRFLDGNDTTQVDPYYLTQTQSPVHIDPEGYERFMTSSLQTTAAGDASEHAQRFADGLNAKHGQDGPWPGYHTFHAQPGKKYDKIVQTHAQPDGSTPEHSGAVHAFVDRETGQVYKPAGWQAPAKGVRYQNVDDALKHSDPFGGYLYAGRNASQHTGSYGIVSPDGTVLNGMTYDSEEEAKQAHEEKKRLQQSSPNNWLQPANIAEFAVKRLASRQTTAGLSIVNDGDLQQFEAAGKVLTVRLRASLAYGDNNQPVQGSTKGTYEVYDGDYRSVQAGTARLIHAEDFCCSSNERTMVALSTYDWVISQLHKAKMDQMFHDSSLHTAAYEQEEHTLVGVPLMVDVSKCRTCGAKILGINGKWAHDPRASMPDHPAGSVAGDAHKVLPVEEKTSAVQALLQMEADGQHVNDEDEAEYRRQMQEDYDDEWRDPRTHASRTAGRGLICADCGHVDDAHSGKWCENCASEQSSKNPAHVFVPQQHTSAVAQLLATFLQDTEGEDDLQRRHQQYWDAHPDEYAEHLRQNASRRQAAATCPDCGGPLVQAFDTTDNYERCTRCGHVFPAAHVEQNSSMGSRREAAAGDACYHPRSCPQCDSKGSACGRHHVGDSGHERCRGNGQKQAVNDSAYGTDRYQHLDAPAKPSWITEWADQEMKATKEMTEQGLNAYVPPNPFPNLTTLQQIRNLALKQAADDFDGFSEVGEIPETDTNAATGTDETTPMTTKPRQVPKADEGPHMVTVDQQIIPPDPMPQMGQGQAEPQMGSGGGFDMGYAPTQDPMQPTPEQMVAAKVARLAQRIELDNPSMSREESRRLAAMTVAKHPEMVKVQR